MVTNIANITFTIILKVMYCLTVGIFTFDLGSLQRSSQGHAHFECEYFISIDSYGKDYYIENHVSAYDW